MFTAQSMIVASTIAPLPHKLEIEFVCSFVTGTVESEALWTAEAAGATSGVHFVR